MAFSCENRDLETRAFMARSGVAVREPISRVTMPLFNVDAGRLWATSVMLEIGEKFFLLTAAHIFDNWLSRPIPINITDGVNGGSIFPIGEATLRRSPTENHSNRLADDHFDICVCDLPDEAAKRVKSGGRFRFLDLSELDPWGEEELRSWYMVFGFPGELNEREVAPGVLGSNACAYSTFIYGGERGNIPWTDADRGVGILMDYGSHTTQNDAGQLVRPPEPYGMSGGGMWRVAEYGCDPSGWGLAGLKLIGIQSAAYTQQRVLQGTRIEHHLGMIYRGHEDLRPAMELAYGDEECRRRFL